MLHNEKYIFSAYIDNKTVVFACNDFNKTQHLKNSITNVRLTRGKWLNKATSYSVVKLSSGVESNTIELCESSRTFSSTFNTLSIAELNLHESMDLKFIDMIYQLNNIEIFITTDFEIKWRNILNDIVPILSIQGVMLPKPATETFDVIEYLNALHPLDL